jgi:hypothetical protein
VGDTASTVDRKKNFALCSARRTPFGVNFAHYQLFGPMP